MTLTNYIIEEFYKFLNKHDAFDRIDRKIQEKYYVSIKDTYLFKQTIDYYLLDFDPELSPKWKRLHTRLLSRITSSNFDEDIKVRYPKDAAEIRNHSTNIFTGHHFSKVVPRYGRINEKLYANKYFLKYSKNFLDNLLSMPDAIQEIFYRPYENLPFNYIDVSDTGEISYIPDRSLNRKFDDPYNNNYRQVSTFGRMIVKLVGDIYASSVLEKINFIFKSNMTSENIEIWEGEDIKKAYLVSNYSHETNYSTLWNSCMRHSSCQNYFDFYIKAGTKIVVELDNNRKIVSRALLWNTDKGMFLDRVYSTKDEKVLRFIKSVNKVIPLEYYKISRQYFTMCDDKPVWPVFTIVKPELINYSKAFPYCDTFSVYYPEMGLITNSNRHYILNSTCGGHS